MIEAAPRAHVAIDDVIERSQSWFRRTQFADGFWWAELESNATMDAEYILMTHVIGQRNDTIWRGVAQDIRSYQRADGSWALYEGAPGDLSTTIECYFALKLAGDSGPHLDRARDFARSRGGIANTRVFTRIWLALCGEWSWEQLPAMPPELMLLPARAPISIYRFSSWARATIVPLLLLMEDRPVRPVPMSARLDDLRVATPAPAAPRDTVDRVFLAIDTVLHAYHRLPWHPLRARARAAAERWIVAHQEADGSWGGIQPPTVYSLMALHALGYGAEHPVMRRGIDGMHDRWMIRRGDGSVRVQACLSPVWDTALSLVALLESGTSPADPAVDRAAQWLRDEEVRAPGDWCVWAPGVEPSGWAFEFENDTYPDIDDTAVVLVALHRAGALDAAMRRRALAWVLALQSKNGGWAAFDKDNTSRLPALIPFADFGEMIDPPSADVTAHVIEMLAILGLDRGHPAITKGLDYLYAQQEPDGSWFGRWGVNHIYGTGAVLPALAAAGEPMDALAVRRAVRWLGERQNPDGGFGEGCESYVDPRARGRGPSTPSQTAWALLALVAADRADSIVARRAAGYLVDTQRADGGWDEQAFTGCGFPGYAVGELHGARIRQGRELRSAFLLRYHLYRDCFPLLALGRYRTALGSRAEVPTVAPKIAAVPRGRPWSYYQHWLDEVSRSFALCIPQLEPPLRDQVALAYLLFRVLDTIEDAPFAESATQQLQFERLRAFLRTRPSPADIDAFVAAFPPGVTDAERALLHETHVLLEQARALPSSARAVTFRALDRMALGMAAYTRRPGPFQLLDGEDVSRYCCFVAGVVGEMLTRLWALDRAAQPPRTANAYHFGLFLQKVNILKDQAEDEAAGRFLVPDRTELLASLGRDARGALGYLHAIPCGDRYRVFCAWSLMLGAVTIAQLDGPKRSHRDEVREMLARTSAIIDDDYELARQFVELMPTFAEVTDRVPRPKPESLDWFRRTLAAPLSDAELRELGIPTAWLSVPMIR
jgi:squalene-hopene/tetraprenyl-beta-curcumene cyclase